MRVTPANMRALTKLAPEALQPAWLAHTWVGEFGSGGLRAVTDDVASSLSLTRSGLTGRATMSGSVLDDGGEVVGEIERYVALHDTGRLEVHHTLLDIDEEFQGTGFARAFNQQVFSRYADAGVDDVTVFAALDVGGYAWARQGFELLSNLGDDASRELDRATQIRELVQEAHGIRSISRQEFRALEPRLISKHGELPPDALTSVQELAAIPDLGRRILLGQAWDGIRQIAATKPWWEGRVPTGIADAQAGVGWLARPDDALAASRHLDSAVRSRMPAALDPARSSAALERAIGGTVDSAETSIYVRQSTASQLESKLGLELDGSYTRFRVTAEAGSGVRVDALDDIPPGDGFRKRIEDTWRSLGATTTNLD
jgi:hypothetical protein